MRKSIYSVLVSVALLLFSYSCRQDESVSPVGAGPKAGDYKPVNKIILDGISVRDSLNFYYSEGKVATVNWCTRFGGSCIVGYSELRSYNHLGGLDHITGRWTTSYSYENNVREKITAYRDGLYFSTTTFLEYAGTYPVKIKVEYSTSEVNYVDVTFNSSGDLVHKTIKDGQGVLLEETQIQYSAIENPLQKLMETPSYAVLFFGFDDLVFYHSKHVPQTVTTSYSNTAVFPKNMAIQYSYDLDGSGRLLSAHAFHDQNNVHNIIVGYDK